MSTATAGVTPIGATSRVQRKKGEEKIREFFKGAGGSERLLGSGHPCLGFGVRTRTAAEILARLAGYCTAINILAGR